MQATLPHWMAATNLRYIIKRDLQSSVRACISVSISSNSPRGNNSKTPSVSMPIARNVAMFSIDAYVAYFVASAAAATAVFVDGRWQISGCACVHYCTFHAIGSPRLKGINVTLSGRFPSVLVSSESSRTNTCFASLSADRTRSLRSLWQVPRLTYRPQVKALSPCTCSFLPHTQV